MSSTTETTLRTTWKSERPRANSVLRMLVMFSLLLGLGIAVWKLAPIVLGSLSERTEVAEGATYKVVRRAVTDSVVERGTLESQNTVEGRCDLPGWENKIIFIVPEGSLVKKGDVVVRFDSANIDKSIAEYQSKLIEAEGKLEQAKQALEVQNNKNESDIAAAELELTLAKLDLEKYRDGDYIAEKAEMERSISEGEAELKKASEELANLRILVRKGFRSPEQLRELESRLNSFESRVERDKQKYRVLIDFDHKRKITEFEAKAIEAERKLARAKTTADAETKKMASQIGAAQSEVELVKSELSDLETHKINCEILAPQAGTVAFANQEWYDDSRRIREGTAVRRQQTVFYLPDMSKMQAKVNVHESVVNKIKKNMPVSVRVDAYPDLPLKGKVSFVAELAASSFGTAKNYEVVVMIDEIAESMKIKPGMTAQVEIFVGRYADIVAVPVGAITEHHQSSYIYVREAVGQVIRRMVSTGRSTHSFIEITEGLAEDEMVMLDAYQRGIKDFGESERDTSSLSFESNDEVEFIDPDELVVDAEPGENDQTKGTDASEAQSEIAATASSSAEHPVVASPESPEAPALIDRAEESTRPTTAEPEPPAEPEAGQPSPSTEQTARKLTTQRTEMC